jgi:hypothetical protein
MLLVHFVTQRKFHLDSHNLRNDSFSSHSLQALKVQSLPQLLHVYIFLNGRMKGHIILSQNVHIWRGEAVRLNGIIN